MKAWTFVQNVWYCIGSPYENPGTTNLAAIIAGAGVDCSGLLVAAGAKVSHGSNTMWRKELTEKGSISDHHSTNGYPKNVNALKSSQLELGMAVFKWQKDTPKQFGDSLGDYCHVGVVTGVNPLRITHASSDYGFVATDNDIGKFCAWGKLKGIEYEAGTAVPEGGSTMYQAKVKCNLNVRKQAGETNQKVGLLKTGTIVNVYETVMVGNREWSRVNYNDEIAGWSVSSALQKIKGSEKPSDDVSSSQEAPAVDEPENVTLQMFRALEARVKALEQGIDMGD